MQTPDNTRGPRLCTGVTVVNEQSLQECNLTIHEKTAIKTTKRMEKQNSWGPREKQVRKTEFKKKNTKINPYWPKHLGWETKKPPSWASAPPSKDLKVLTVYHNLPSAQENPKGITLRNTGRASRATQKSEVCSSSPDGQYYGSAFRERSPLLKGKSMAGCLDA